MLKIIKQPPNKRLKNEKYLQVTHCRLYGSYLVLQLIQVLWHLVKIWPANTLQNGRHNMFENIIKLHNRDENITNNYNSLWPI